MLIENVNQGLIFPNEKTKDTAPDFTGAINVDGEQYQIALWWKDFERGGEGFSVKISEPYEGGRSSSRDSSRGSSRSSGRPAQRPAAARPAADTEKLTPRPKPSRR